MKKKIIFIRTIFHFFHFVQRMKKLKNDIDIRPSFHYSISTWKIEKWKIDKIW